METKEVAKIDSQALAAFERNPQESFRLGNPVQTLIEKQLKDAQKMILDGFKPHEEKKSESLMAKQAKWLRETFNTKANEQIQGCLGEVSKQIDSTAQDAIYSVAQNLSSGMIENVAKGEGAVDTILAFAGKGMLSAMGGTAASIAFLSASSAAVSLYHYFADNQGDEKEALKLVLQLKSAGSIKEIIERLKTNFPEKKLSKSSKKALKQDLDAIIFLVQQMKLDMLLLRCGEGFSIRDIVKEFSIAREDGKICFASGRVLKKEEKREAKTFPVLLQRNILLKKDKKRLENLLDLLVRESIGQKGYQLNGRSVILCQDGVVCDQSGKIIQREEIRRKLKEIALDGLFLHEKGIDFSQAGLDPQDGKKSLETIQLYERFLEEELPLIKEMESFVELDSIGSGWETLEAPSALENLNVSGFFTRRQLSQGF